MDVVNADRDIAPVIAGVLARGIATFSGGTDTASIVFGSPVRLGWLRGQAHDQLRLGHSGLADVRQQDHNQGFDIKVTDSAFVGTVDWEAAL